MKALLIIDMQNISFRPETPRYDTDGIIERINTLSRHFRKAGQRVLFIQHDGSAEGICIPGTKEWEIVAPLEINPGDLRIRKTVNDAFYRSALLDELKRYQVDEVMITGCATDFCVDATVKTALVHDLNVTVVSDGHTTADRPGLEAKQVIDHYNWVWSEMYATEGWIRVLESKACIKEIKGRSKN